MTADAELLARWRTLGARHSEEVLELGPRVLRSGGLGDQEWAVREQLAIAALDTGRIALATEQLTALQRRFADSPRVEILKGLKLEAEGDVSGAQKLYSGLLVKDETNISAHQRLIALSHSTPSVSAQTTITHLLSYLDTFYSDPSAWSLLADLYAEQGMYQQALAALGHLSVLQIWDTGAVRKSAEVAYTLGDYDLALKFFLRAVEMETDPSDLTLAKANTRTWWGVKLATRRLLDRKSISSSKVESAVPESQKSTQQQLKALDALATERILAAGGTGMEVKRKVLAGSEGTEPVR